jgi:diguanylate cyclase (GGDEF)-like protein
VLRRRCHRPGSNGARGAIGAAPPRADQLAQFLTRYLFAALGLAYFNLGEPPRTSPWIGVALMNAVLAGYFLVTTVLLWHARRRLQAPWRWRAAMWVDLLVTSVAVLADASFLSPIYLTYLVVILGNGMRYGSPLFAEGALGGLLLGALVLAWRLSAEPAALNLTTLYFFLLGGILVLYAYALSLNLERTRCQLEAERSLDALTGLLNRRALREQADTLFHGLRRGEHSGFAVLFADLDRFKQVNDSLGHHAGDRVLAEVARLIAANVRAGDIAARYGGDEFLLLLPGADLGQARRVAQRLQEALAVWSVAQGVGVSLSVGLARAPEHGNDLETLLMRVDEVLYRCKQDPRRGQVRSVEPQPAYAGAPEA